MKYAVLLPVDAGVTADPEWIGAYVQHAGTCGFESAGAVEHTVVASGYSSVLRLVVGMGWMREEIEACGADFGTRGRRAGRNGRDPSALELTLGHSLSAVTPEKADKPAALGASRLVLGGNAAKNLDEARDGLSACAQRLGLP